MPDRARPDVPPDPPHRVAAAMSVQEWRAISFLHWRVLPEDVAPRLPEWLRADTYDGSAWLSVVPLSMRVAPPIGPVVPWLGEFAETNARTYVIGPDGERGLWFLTMDASRGLFVASARAMGLPYVWSSMRVDTSPYAVRYELRGRFAGAPDARSVIELEPGAAIEEPSALDRFLTARFRLYARGPLGPFTVAVDHAPWRLRTARIRQMNDGIAPATGVRVEGDPIVHYSDGVRVRVGLPRFVTVEGY